MIERLHRLAHSVLIEEDLRNILATHKPEPFPVPVQKQLDAIVKKYKAAAARS